MSILADYDGMNINQRFSRVLRKLRKDKNLTQLQLAQSAGIDYKYLQKLEGKEPSSPSLEVLSRLATALGLSISRLVRDL